MSTHAVLPTLSAWAASRLTGLLQSKTQSAFNAAFDATFAAHCNVVYNGEPISRDAYKAKLLQESAAAPEENSAVVNIEGQTEVETGNQGQLSGLVGLFYTSLSDSKFLVLGAPAESRASSSINLVIEPTEKNPQNPNLHIHGYFDPRRVVAVNQVAAETSYHVTIPSVSVPKVAVDKSAPKVELGPGPLRIPQHLSVKPPGGWVGGLSLGPFGGAFGPGPVVLPGSETGIGPERLPGDGAFGVAPVNIPGETIGESRP